MSLLYRIIFLAACCWSHYCLAGCQHPSPQQSIVITQSDGNVTVSDKANSETCHVANNGSNDDNQGSQLVWSFEGLACAKGDCVVEIAGAPNLDERILKCDQGGPNNSKCRLKVNMLKGVCDVVDGGNSEQCTIHYVIKVRGTEIDPSIIIKPRPTTE